MYDGAFLRKSLTAKSCFLFSRKRSIIDVGSKYLHTPLRNQPKNAYETIF